jgi:hypothetical protein
MNRTTISACVFAVATSLGGCGAGEVEYGGAVHVTSPELVAVGPGIQVVADADEPLFYSDGAYWLYRASNWYRSDNDRSGFAPIEPVDVPVAVRTIDRPQMYVQYRRHVHREPWARARRPQERTSGHSQPAYPQPTDDPSPQPNAIPLPQVYPPTTPNTAPPQPNTIPPSTTPMPQRENLSTS